MDGVIRSRRRWAWAGLGALVLLNLLLVTLLLRPTEPPATGREPYPAFTPGDAAAGELSPAPTPEQSLEPLPSGRIIVAASDSLAWRTAVGDCATPATVERTTDGGATWTALDVGLAAVVRMKATSVSDVFAIGGGGECAPSFRFSDDAGDGWVNDDGELAGSWYLRPSDRGVVHGPRGEVPVPCTGGVVDLAGLDNSRAALLCTDGVLFATGDGGASWSTIGSAEQAVALAPGWDGYIAGVLRPDACAGVVVVPFDANGAGLDTQEFVCAPVTDAQPGAVALASAGDALWLWSGDEVVISRDRGATW